MSPHKVLYEKPDCRLGAVSADGRFLLANRIVEGQIMDFDLLNAQTGELLSKLPFASGYYEFSFTPDGSLLAAMETISVPQSGQQARLSLWRFEPGEWVAPERPKLTTGRPVPRPEPEGSPERKPSWAQRLLSKLGL